jgi:hypothetical protein
VCYAARAQRPLVTAKNGKSILNVHINIAQNVRKCFGI